MRIILCFFSCFFLFRTSYGLEATCFANSGFGRRALKGFIMAIKILKLIQHYPFCRANSFIRSVMATTLSIGNALYIETRKPPTLRWPFTPTIPSVLAEFQKFLFQSGIVNYKRCIH